MTGQGLLLAGLRASIFLTVLTIGLGTSSADLRYLLGKPPRLLRALLTMNVIGPIIAIVVCKLFSLHPAVAVGLVTLAIAPVSNLFPRSMLPLVAADGGAYARGLFFTTSILSVILTPLAVEVIDVLLGRQHHVSAATVAQVVVAGVLLPLGAGMAMGRWRPAVKRWIPALQTISSVALVLCALVLIAATWSLMGSLVRQGTVSAIVLITVAGLGVGHALGGPDEDHRTVLAHASVSRHPGVAVTLASLTPEPLAPIGVLLAVLVSAIAVAPYTRWRKRLHAAGHPAGGDPASAR
jgi:BASS family bile acid:Na+ symporter